MPATTKQDRLEARVSESQKRLFRRAAAFECKSLTELVVTPLQDAANRIVQVHETMEITGRNHKAFIEARMNPPAPNKALRDAARAHARLIGRR